MPLARLLHLATAAFAILGLVLGYAFAIADAYPPTAPIDPGLFDAGGTQSMLGRLADFSSYFTIWSNVLVAIVFGILAARPDRDSRLMRVLLFDALLMILITGIVYNAVIAPAIPPREGLDLVTTTIQHLIVPLLALGSWLVVGPRGWLRRDLILPALAIPIAWVALTLIRGAVIDAYPYGFLNVVDLGYLLAIVNVLVILAIGIALCAMLIGLDRLARRWTRTPVGI